MSVCLFVAGATIPALCSGFNSEMSSTVGYVKLMVGLLEPFAATGGMNAELVKFVQVCCTDLTYSLKFWSPLNFGTGMDEN